MISHKINFLIILIFLHSGAVISDVVNTSQDAQTQLQQAAKNFDAFAIQMPKVVTAKIDLFLKNGFQMILAPQPTQDEEDMINSFLSGLLNMRKALEYDMTPYLNKRRNGIGIDPEKIHSEYHSSQNYVRKPTSP